MFYGRKDLPSRVGRAGFFFFFLIIFFVISGSKNDPKKTKISKKKNIWHFFRKILEK